MAGDSLPGERRLFVVRDPCLSTVDRNLAELIDDGGRGREDVLTEYAYGQHRAIAHAEVEQLGDARRIEIRDQRAVRFRDLRWIGSKKEVVSSPHDYRCDPKTRAGRVVVEEP